MKTQRIDNKKQSQLWLFLFITAIAFIVSITVGLSAKLDISYVPYNGDWQHYNMFRRLLEGQVPYRDFPVVLGQAILYLNSFVLWLVGNTFANSIFSTNFIGAFAGFIIVAILLQLFFDDKIASVTGSLFLELFVLNFSTIQNLPLIKNISIFNQIINYLDRLLAKFAVLYLAGNSSRSTRVLIVYLAALIVLTGYNEWYFGFIKNRPHISSIVTGAVGGLLILWANDYGSSTYVAFSFCFFLLIIKRTKKFRHVIISTLEYIGGTLASVSAVMSLITCGHLLLWIKQTFSITDFLWWFDGVFFDRKRLQLSTYPPFSGEYVLPIALSFIALVILIVLFFKYDDKRILGHIHILTTFFVFLYLNLLNNGFEAQYVFSFIQYTSILIIFLSLALFRKLRKGNSHKVLLKRVGTVITALLLIVSSVFCCVNILGYNKRKVPDDAYIPQLGGNCYTWYQDLNETSLQLGDATLFSTYGSAIEVIKGTMQPTRYDYITHVFGDEARAEYIRIFKEQNPDYVSILNRNYTKWEAWVCNENWFFYREFAENYRFDFANTFCRYLKRTEKSNIVETETQVQINQISDHEVEIVVTADEKEKTLIADVLITYNSDFTSDRLKNLAVKRLVCVNGDADYLYPSDAFDAWFLPNSADEHAIPILINDGVGRIVLSTRPGECTKLSVTDVAINKIYDFNMIFGY